LATLELRRFERQFQFPAAVTPLTQRRSKQTACGILIYETTETDKAIPAQERQQARKA